MGKSNTNKEHINQRRERIAQLNLRGLSSREIAAILANGDANGQGRIFNPDTGKPYDQKTILADLKFLREEWINKAGVNTGEHMARQFAEIQEIKRAAWGVKDPELVLKSLDREIKITGTSKPIEMIITLELQTTLVQIIQLMEQRGDSPGETFEMLLRDLQNADIHNHP